jgi:hypothetical protein
MKRVSPQIGKFGEKGGNGRADSILDCLNSLNSESGDWAKWAANSTKGFGQFLLIAPITG